MGEGADVTGEGEDFQNLKMVLRAFRIGATRQLADIDVVYVKRLEMKSITTSPVN